MRDLSAFASNNEVRLAWVAEPAIAASSGEAGIAEPTEFLVVVRQGDNSRLVKVTAPSAGTTITGLRNGVEASFEVLALTPDGSSEPAGPVTATPLTGMEGEVAGLIVAFEPGVSVADGQQLVPGEQRVDQVDLSVEGNVTEDLTLVAFSESVPLEQAREIAADLAADPSVDWAEPDQFLFTASDDAADVNAADPVASADDSTFVPSDPQYATSQWNLWSQYGIGLGEGATSMTKAWEQGRGDGATVAVIDTGITPHPDLTNRLVAGYDFVSNPEQLASSRQPNAPPVAFDGDYVDSSAYGDLGRDANAADPGDWREVAPARSSTWHGTQIAGLIAAESNDDAITGIAPDARIQPIRALSWRGGLLSDIAASITWASGGTIDGVPTNQSQSDVINMSFSVEAICPSALQDAINGARERGSVLIAAAGNAAQDAATAAPGNCDGVVTVGATNRDGSRADYSNFGPRIDLSAPGGESAAPITTLSNDGEQLPEEPSTGTTYGTSIAAAHVSAAAAILKGRESALTPDDIESALTGSVRTFAGVSCDVEPSRSCGAGILSLAEVAGVSAGDQDLAMTFSKTAGTYAYADGAQSALQITGSISIEAWVKLDGECTNDGVVLRKKFDYGIWCGGTSWYYALGKTGETPSTRGTNQSIAIGRWQHVALTRETGQDVVRFYVDGQLAYTGTTGGAGTGPIATSSDDVEVSSYLKQYSFFPGQVDEVRLFNSARSASEILADMHQYGPTNTSGLVAYYDFNEGPAGTSGSGTVANRANGATAATSLRTVKGPTYADVAQIATSGSNTVISFPRSYLNAAGGWRAPSSVVSVDRLIVGGGGSGGAGRGGGGGAGALVEGTASVSAGGVVAVVVGQGGRTQSGTSAGANGQPSTFASLSSTGGGAGGGFNSATATSGGSGGGGAGGDSFRDGALAAGTGLVNAGGRSIPRAGGGGGGASTVGSAAVLNTTGGAGGAGSTSAITGLQYGGGGGGGGYADGSTTAGAGGQGGGGAGCATVDCTATSGTANTGGGGGGAGDNGTLTSSSYAGVSGSGGSGSVVVQYASSVIPTGTCSPMQTGYVSGSSTYRVLAFKQTGSCTWSVPAGVAFVDYLVVGGGGSGATYAGGGGGAGGMVEATGRSVTSGALINVSVGGGGPRISTYYTSGADGTASSLSAGGLSSTITATGGGGGVADGAGGSAGTGGYSGAGYYNQWAGGGGGGAGSAGSGLNGGSGRTSTTLSSSTASALGLATVFGGGGGSGVCSGGSRPAPNCDNPSGGTPVAPGAGGSGGSGGGGAGTKSNVAATAGSANTGGGGGGSGYYQLASGNPYVNFSGEGGSGVIVIRYAVPCVPTTYRSGTSTIVEFRGGGSCTWTVPAGVNVLQKALAVGAGGGGGSWVGGGGGGGGVVEQSTAANLAVTAGNSISVTVGTGGIGSTNTDSATRTNASSGGSSSFGSIASALGGGLGGSYSAQNPAGSGTANGGGGSNASIGPGVGAFFSGGAAVDGGPYSGGGGGGASSNGLGATSAVGGAGGSGAPSAITGATVAYGGGGGGGVHDAANRGGAGGAGGGGAGNQLALGGSLAAVGSDGTDGLGGGGGGGGSANNLASRGGDGGDGVVIISYQNAANPPTSPSATASASGQVTVSWTAPTPYLGDGAISGYGVSQSTDGTTYTSVSAGTCSTGAPTSTSTSCTVTGLTAGTAYTFKVATITTAGSTTYTSADSSATGSVTVFGALSKFAVTATDGTAVGTQTAGTSFAVKITAQDSGGRTVTTFTSTVDLTSTSLFSAGSGTTAAFSSGVLASRSVTLIRAGSSQTLTATSTSGTETGTSEAFTISAGTASKLQVLLPGQTAAPGTATGKTSTPTAQTAGTSLDVTVNAVDANWNVVTSATPTVAITTSDGNATLPSDGQLVSGTKTFAVTLKTAGSQTVTATDKALTGAISVNISTAVTVNPGAASKLVVSSIAQQVAGTGFGVTVTLTDANGNAVNNATAAGTVTLSVATGSGTLTATTGSIAVGASAVTISGVTYSKAESGVSLTATGSVGGTVSGKSGTSGTFAVIAGSATKLVVSSVAQQVAGTAFDVTVTLADANGNAVDNATASGTVTLTQATGTAGALGGTVTGSIAVGASSVTISGVTYSKAESASLTATGSGGGLVTGKVGTSNSFSVIAGAASKLVVSSIGQQVAGAGFGVTVTLTDANGNAVNNATAAGTVTLSVSTGAGTLAAATGSIAVGSSSVTISGVTYSKAESGVSITATGSVGGLVTGKSGTSNTFTIVAGSATKLVVSSIGQQVAGTGFGVTVTLTDANGNPVNADATGTVTLTRATGNGTLATATGTIANGASAVTILGVTYSMAESDVSLTATGSGTGLVSGKTGTSNTFTVVAGAATKLVVSSIGQQVAGTGFGVTVTLTDANGNAVNADATGTVTVTRATGTGTLATATGTIASGASAVTILGVTYSMAETGVSLTATGSGTGLVSGKTGTSNTFTVVAGTASKLVVSSIGQQVAGTGFGVTVTLTDANGNAVNADASGTVTLTRSTGNGTLTASTGTIASGASAVTISGVTYAMAESGVSLTATGSGAGLVSGKTGTSATFTVIAGSATKLLVSSIGQQVAGTGFGVTVTLTDANGNAVSNATASGTVTLTVATGSGTLTATTGSIAVGASAVTISGVTYSKAETGVSFTATGSVGGTVSGKSGTSGTFAVVAGSATKLVVSSIGQQVAGTGFGVTVTLTDANGNAVNADASGTVTLTRATGNGTLTASTGTIANGASAVTISGVTYSMAESGVSLTATGSGAGLVNGKTGTSATFTVVAGSATKLVVSSIAQQVAGTGFGVTVTLTDANGNAVNNATASGTVTLTVATGEGTLVANTGSISAGSSSVTIPGVTYSKAESGVSLTATGSVGGTVNGKSGTSGTFAVIAGSATKLVVSSIAQQVAGTAFDVTVTLTDANGNAVNNATASGTVTLTQATGTAGALGGTVTGSIAVGASSVTISGVTYSKAESASLTATGSGGGLVTGKLGTSNTFSVIVGSPTKLVVTSIAQQVAGTGFGVTVTLTDDNGNAVNNATTAGTVTLSVATGSGTLVANTGTIAVGASSVTISGVTYSMAESGVSFTATGTGGGFVTGKSGTSNTFTVIAGSATKLIVSSIGQQVAGTGFGVTVTLTDTNGNAVNNATASGTVTLTVATGAGTLTATTGSIAVGASAVTISGVSYSKAETGVSFTATGSVGGTVSGKSGTSGTFAVVAGSPTKLVVSSIAQQVAAATFGVTVTLTDANGNPVNASADGAVALTQATGTSGALAGTLSGTIVSGASAVTISGLTYSKAESTSLTATGSGTGNVNGKTGTSNSFSVIAGSATKLVVSSIAQQIAGTAFGVTVTLTDANGNAVNNATASGTVTLTVATGAGTLVANTGSISAGSSSVTIPGVTYSKAESGVSLTATGSVGGTVSGKSGTSGTFAVIAGSATKLVVLSIAQQVAGTAFDVTVTLTDANGNAVNNATASGTVTLTRATGNGTLTAATGSIGVGSSAVTITGVTYSKAETGVSLTATGSLGGTVNGKSGTSDTFTVAAGAATKLAVSGASSQAAGASQDLTITAQDANGNTTPTYTGSKTLTFSGATSAPGGQAPSVTNSSGSTVLFGTGTAITFTNGVAAISGSNNGVMKLYNAQVAAVSVTDGAISSSGSGQLSVTVSATTANKLDIGTQPIAGASGALLATQPIVTVLDTYGNLTASTASIAVTSSAPTLGGSQVSGKSAVGGSTTFTNLTFTARTTVTATLTFTSSGLTSATSSSIQATGPGDATTIAVSGGNSQSATAGSGVAAAPAVLVTDASGNPVSGVSVTFAVATGGGSLASPNTVTTNASGIATSPAWTLGTAVGSNSLTATSASLTGSQVTFTATGTPGAAAAIAVTRTASGAPAGSKFTIEPQITVRDANGNTVTGDSTTVVTASVSAGATTVGAITATASSGVATFIDLGLTGTAGTAYTVTFTTAAIGTATQSITVTTGPATKLVLTSPAAGATYGTAWTTQPVLQVQDAGGNRVTTDFATQVAIAAAGATIAGTSPVMVSSGVATFAGLSISAAPATFALTYSATGLVSATQSLVLGQAAQTITFGALPGKTYGDANFTVSATASSGLSVVFSSTTTGVCTVSGSSVQILAAGPCVIAADQAGNANFNAAAQVTQPFTVAKAGQTITFAALSRKTYGDANFSVSATSSSNEAVVFSSTTTGICTVSGTTVQIVAAGTCTIAADQGGNTNYDPAPRVPQSFTVDKASPTLTWSSMTKTYGAAPFTITAVSATGISGALPGTFAYSSQSTAYATVAGTTVSIVRAGSATLEAVFTPTDTANYVTGTNTVTSLTINQSAQTPLTMSSSSSVIYGQTIVLAATGGSGTGSLGFSIAAGTCTTDGTTLYPGDAGTSCGVRATKLGDVNYTSESSPTQTVTISRAGQTLAFISTVPAEPLPLQTYTPTASSISAVTGNASGIVPTFAVTGACSLSNGVVTFTGTGNCTVTASASANTNFLAALSVTQVIAVGSLNQNITFVQPPNVAYGVSSTALSAIASSDLPVMFTLGSGTTSSSCEVSELGVVTVLAVGTCEVVASQPGDGRFAPASAVTRAFQVTPSLSGAPHLASASASDQAITVGFTAPGFTGGVSITAYRIVATPVGAGAIVSTTACTTAPCTISGLVNGTAYTLTAAAINSAGTGPASSASTPMTPATTAFAVGGLAATPGNGFVDLSWIALTTAQLGGGAFTQYEVSKREVGASTWTLITASVTPQSASSYGVTGLTNGTSYDFQIVAITTANSGEIPGNTAQVVQYPSTTPSVPRNVTVLASTATDVQVSWQEPLSDGGSAMTSPYYSVTISSASTGATTPITCTFASVGDRFCSAPGLTNGAAYVISVTASNRMGNSAPGTATYNVPSSNSTLSDLVISGSVGVVPMTPIFESDTDNYEATVTFAVSEVTITPTTAAAGAPVRVNGISVLSGQPSNAIPLIVGVNTITIDVTATDPRFASSYEVVITRAPAPPPSPSGGGGVSPGIPVVPPRGVITGDAVGAVTVAGVVVSGVVLTENSSKSGWDLLGEAFSAAISTRTSQGTPVSMAPDGVMQVNPSGEVLAGVTGYLPGSELAAFMIPRSPLAAAGRLTGRALLAATYIGSAKVGPNGSIRANFTVPSSTTTGDYVLQVNGVTDSDEIRSISLRLNVVTAAKPRVGFTQRSAFFDSQSAKFTNDGARKMSALVSSIPQSATAVRVSIAAVSVSLSTPESNLNLARDRAAVIVKELRARGVKGEYTVSVTTSFTVDGAERAKASPTTTKTTASKRTADRASINVRSIANDGSVQPIVDGAGKPLTTVSISYSDAMNPGRQST